MNLFDESPRPTFNDQMNKELAEIVGKIIHKWCQENNEPQDLEECTEEAEKILRFGQTQNGYELAKDFERKLMIRPDSELVELLDDVWWDSSNILTRHIKAWVQTDHIKPKLKIGDTVKTKINGEEEVGEIVKIDEEIAKYGVCVESLGQVKGKSHYLVEYELVKLIDTHLTE